MAEYCGMDITKVVELTLVEYLAYYRDATIYNLMQTEDGREYLRNAWRIHQIEPDRDALRQNFK